MKTSITPLKNIMDAPSKIKKLAWFSGLESFIHNEVAKTIVAINIGKIFGALWLACSDHCKVAANTKVNPGPYNGHNSSPRSK